MKKLAIANLCSILLTIILMVLYEYGIIKNYDQRWTNSIFIAQFFNDIIWSALLTGEMTVIVKSNSFRSYLNSSPQLGNLFFSFVVLFFHSIPGVVFILKNSFNLSSSYSALFFGLSMFRLTRIASIPWLYGYIHREMSPMKRYHLSYILFFCFIPIAIAHFFLCLLFSKISGDYAIHYIILSFIFIALICFLSLLAYGRHFDRLISSPLYLMNRGFRKRGFYRVIKFNRVLKDHEIFKIANFYNEVYLPAKQKKELNREVSPGNPLSIKDVDDFFKRL
jgi:hypothetical protein